MPKLLTFIAHHFLIEQERQILTNGPKDGLPFQVRAVRNKVTSVHRIPKKTEEDLSKPEIKEQDLNRTSVSKSLTSAQLVDKIAEKTGIVKTHLIPILQVAKETQQIISFRPVDRMSTGLIEEGYPTKGFAIKGKSSNHGPQSGFICVDQNFSKLHVTLQNDKTSRQKHVTKYNASVHECLQKGDAVAVNLTLTKARLKWLENNQIIVVKKAEDNNILKIFSEGLEYTAVKNGDKFEISYEGQPLKVLADPRTRQPLTADYDLMFIAPKTEHLDLAKDDKLPVTRVHYSEVSETYKRRYKDKEGEDFTPKHFFENEEETRGRFGQAVGNATPRIIRMIDKLNEATVGKNGNPVVHHNADSGSPATDPASNYPITVFIPENLAGYDTIHIIENAEQFTEFVKQAKSHGFFVPTNTKWERKISQAKSSSFEHSSLTIRNLLQTRTNGG
jgi:hypothetical protein